MVELTKENKQTEDSLQIALNKLAIIIKTIYEDNQDLFLKNPEEVNIDALNKLSGSFISLSTLFQEVIEEWSNSDSEVFDDVKRSEKLEDQLGSQISETDNIDLDQTKKIINKISKIDDALESLEKISVYLKYYEDLCKQKGLVKQANLSEIFRLYGIEEFSKHLRTEEKQRRNQIDRNNQFKQAKLYAKTLKIAYAAIGISIFSAILTILTLLLK